MPPINPPSDNSGLDRLIASYLESLERGEQPVRQQLLAAHPEDAESLAKFFADLDKVEATKLQVRQTPDVTLIPQHEPKPGVIFGGRYKLLENIGEGGMGSVWVAEQQQPVKRRVAIKLVKSGMDSKQVLARFEAERQALAVMDHPNIAKVFDGGMTEQGRPYFVMEYVKGVPFTEYCDNARLSLKERLNLFIPVCQAVQHAHHKGIVHRDLKPSNILICLYDGKPEPKVIDFGLAKAINQSLTEHSIFTGHGVMVGTPLYMSPEQAEHNNLDVDTRTDIYSLGVVLYELLTGTTPLEREQLRTAAYNEILRLIKEVEPLRPSNRLSGSATLPSIAAQRNIDPRHLQKSVAGDLDWIVMKSLEKERTRRYETATGLARDIERFLSDEAVEACPPSRSYRFKKFIRKNRGQVIAALTVLLALCVGIIGTTLGLLRATKAEKKTQTALHEVTKERDAKNEALNAEAAQREVAERKLIEGLLRPIGFGDSPNTAELRAFVEWSQISDPRLKVRVLEIAFEDPATALRVARRAERAMQACVALSPTRRARVVELTSAIQRDMIVDPGKRAAACWLAMELGSPDMPALAESMDFLDRQTESGFCQFVGDATRRIEADFSSGLRQQLPNLLIERLKLTGDDNYRVAACRTLAAASQEHAMIAADILIDLIGDHSRSNIGARQNAIEELIAMTPQMKPVEMSRNADALIGILKDKSWSYYSDEYHNLLAVSVNGLIALAPYMESSQSSDGWDALISLSESSDEEPVLEVSTLGLNALVMRLDSTTVTNHWHKLINVLRETTNEDACYAAGEGLVALTARLDAIEVTRGWKTVISIIKESHDDIVLYAACDVLVALADRLDSNESRLAAADLLGLLHEDSTNNIVRSYEGRAFARLVPKLEKAGLQSGWEAHFAVLETSTNGYVVESAARAVAALGRALDEPHVAISGTRLIKLIKETDHQAVRDAAWLGIASLAPRLPSEQIIWACDAVLDDLQDSTDNWDESERITIRWHALSPPLEAAQVALCGNRLRSILSASKDWKVLSAAAKCLKDVAVRFDDQQAARSADILAVLLTESNDYDVLRAADDALVTLSSQLDPSRRTRVAELMTESIHIPARAQSFATMTPLLEQDERDRISNSALIILLDMFATSFGYFENDDKSPDFRAFRFAAIAMSNPKAVARAFSHPGCVDVPREFLLQRFEELAFHDGKHIFLTIPGSDKDVKIRAPADPRGRPSERLPKRRFHTLYDAAEWIQQNWPDVDLEATHPVTWHGER